MSDVSIGSKLDASGAVGPDVNAHATVGAKCIGSKYEQ